MKLPFLVKMVRHLVLPLLQLVLITPSFQRQLMEMVIYWTTSNLIEYVLVLKGFRAHHPWEIALST